MMRKKAFQLVIVLLLAVLCAFSSACSKIGEAVDPGAWGYDCCVTYDALGGIINAREVRTTYYLTNSYVYKPSGSDGMLIEPKRDGYVLAGWYTAKAEPIEGSVEDYTFLAEDRWDFNTDRVQEDMTLYARWLPRGKVDYINADTGDILFSKNITSESPIQELSSSVLSMIKPEGMTFNGYYADEACTIPYDFGQYIHVDPNPTEAALYATLTEMFPDYLAAYEYVPPTEEELEDETRDMSWAFLNKLGYQLLTDDEAAIAEINAAKDQLIEQAIDDYLVNTAERVVYIKYTQGNFIRVRSVNDLKIGGKVGLYSEDLMGNPIDGYLIENDIDLSGVAFTVSESFSGRIEGNGHTLKNLTISVSSKKLDSDTQKLIGLTALMDGATIRDLTIENASIKLSVNSGIAVTGGLLAAEGKNVTFENVHFKGLSINSGNGDDGKAKYILGDLFGSSSGCTFTGCTAEDLTVEVRRPQSLTLAIFTLPAAE